MKLVQKLKYKATLECLSGLHIGNSKETGAIGGVDAPVVRRKDNNVPYLPGSSIKGKIRCLLEQVYGSSKVGGNAEVNSLFGSIVQGDQKPSRLIVRDAYMDKSSQDILADNDNLDLPYSEVKHENTIHRIKGTAEHPRQIERVPAGTIFNLEFIITVFEKDGASENEDGKLENMLKEGIELLNNDYLGGSGTRGYGHVNISLGEPEIVFPKKS